MHYDPLYLFVKMTEQHADVNTFVRGPHNSYDHDHFFQIDYEMFFFNGYSTPIFGTATSSLTWFRIAVQRKPAGSP